eukprot:g14309.t1
MASHDKEELDVDDVIRQLKEQAGDDYLRVGVNKDLIRFLAERENADHLTIEKLRFSDSCLKLDRRGKLVERHLVISDYGVYNFIPDQYKKAHREVPVRLVKGIIITNTSDDMILQVKDNPDIRMSVVRRADLIRVLNDIFISFFGKALPVRIGEDLDRYQSYLATTKKVKEEDKGSHHHAHGPSFTRAPHHRDASQTFVPKRRLSSENQISVQGWLTKKGMNANSGWRQRYFRLAGSNLLYYSVNLKDKVCLDGGVARGWENRRVSVDAREVERPHSGPDHLRSLLRDPERAAAFMQFCESIHSEENLSFYLAVEAFRKLDEEKLDKQAKEIVKMYVRPGADKEISAPMVVREQLQREGETNKITDAYFDRLQNIVLSQMKVNEFPAYMEHSAKKSKETVDLKIKTKLSKQDMEVRNCCNCAKTFGLLTKRNFCRYCSDVFCAMCLTKSCSLPEHYMIKGPVKVCDMCFAVLQFETHPHAFSYANRQKHLPINMAASSPEELESWLSVFSQALKLQHDAKDKQQSGHEDAEKKLAELRKEAWLMKEDQGTKTWKSYYMVLSGSMLYCYELNLRGSTPLAEGGGVHADITSTEPTIDRSKLALGVYSESLYSYKFSISVKQRLYSLAADTEEQRKIWMQQIERALARSKSASSAPVRSDQYATAFAQPAPEGEVTFVFTDVQNSTNLWEAVSTGMNKALKIHDSLMRMLLKQFRGYEVKTEGDAFMVTFFNVLDAVRWCLAVQTSLLQSSWPDDLLEQPAASKVVAENGDLLFSGIRVRMGIHVGFPNCRRNPITGRMDYFGPTVNRSARVADSAHGGQIICTDEVAVKLQSAIQAKTFDRAVHFTKLGYDMGDFKMKGSTSTKALQSWSPYTRF